MLCHCEGPNETCRVIGETNYNLVLMVVWPVAHSGSKCLFSTECVPAGYMSVTCSLQYEPTFTFFAYSYKKICSASII